MSAADDLIRATISALSASFSVTGPLAALMYSVLPSTLSRVPATRCAVGCCADAVETANTAARAAAVMIRILLMSVLPMGLRAVEHTPIGPNGEAGAEGARPSARFPERVSPSCGVPRRTPPRDQAPSISSVILQ